MQRPGYPVREEVKPFELPVISNEKKEADIIIVTNKPTHKIQLLIMDINRTIDKKRHRVIFTGNEQGSASQNRNIGLNQVTADYVIMLDDDIEGFYKGWADNMVNPLKENHDIMIVSANIRKPDGSPAPAMGCDSLDREGKGLKRVESHDFEGYKRVPTACVSFRRNPLRFDEAFVGSGAEDTAWCNLMNMIYGGEVVMNMDCRLIHKNHCQNQGGNNARINRLHYNQLFPKDRWTFK